MSFARGFRVGVGRALGLARARGVSRPQVVGRPQAATTAFSRRRWLASSASGDVSNVADSSDYLQALDEELERVGSQRAEWLAVLKRAATERNVDAALQLIGNMRALVRCILSCCDHVLHHVVTLTAVP